MVMAGPSAMADGRSDLGTPCSAELEEARAAVREREREALDRADRVAQLEPEARPARPPAPSSSLLRADGEAGHRPWGADVRSSGKSLGGL